MHCKKPRCPPSIMIRYAIVEVESTLQVRAQGSRGAKGGERALIALIWPLPLFPSHNQPVSRRLRPTIQSVYSIFTFINCPLSP